MKLGILTISDSVPVGKRQDLSGPKIDEVMAPLFAEVFYLVCTDDITAIRDNVLALLPAVDLLITNGGTGMMYRDNTGEALAVIDCKRLVPLERAISAAMILACGPLAAIATPVAMLADNSYVIALPGKTDEVEAALTAVIKPFVTEHLLLGQCPYSQRRLSQAIKEVSG